jgi:hypothetical protein
MAARPKSRLQNYAVGAQRASDVLQILLAHIGDGELELAPDLLVGRGREADAAGLGDSPTWSPFGRETLRQKTI